MKKILAVIGTVIVAPVIVGLLVNWLTPVDVLGAIASVSSAIGGFLRTGISIPFWALALIAFSWPILRAIALCFPRNEEDDALPPEMAFLTYTSDSFLGVKWLWSYAGNRIDDDKITARCPQCDCLLDWVQESGYRIIDDITLVCSHCGFRKQFDRNEDGLTRLVHQQIDRKIVTGEFRKDAQPDESSVPSKAAPSASSDVR